MLRVTRTVLIPLLLALPLGACTSGYDFDPSDLLPSDWFNTKKKLPGDRKAVFPEGVPGVARGLPPDLMKGNQSGDVALAPANPQASARSDDAKSRPKSQPKSKAAPKSESATNQSTGPVDARWPDQPPPQRQQQQRPQQQQQQPPQQQSEWPEPPSAPRQQRPANQWPDQPSQTQQGGQQVQWPDPPPAR
jgi:hypothetical protein